MSGAAARDEHGSDAAEPVAYQYAVLRVVPRVDRGEFVNAGVLMHCPARSWLRARVELDRDRVAALAPGLTDAEWHAVVAALDGVRATVAGRGAGGDEPPARRFGWLVAPRSAVVQPGPVHAGLAGDLSGTLEHLFARLVATGHS